MAYIPKVGDVIKMHSWHGVVLDVFKNDAGGTVLRVHTARNVFRGYPPEFIEVDVAPDSIFPATREDLEKEIEKHRALRDAAVAELMAYIG
jgi:hypothetical protein